MVLLFAGCSQQMQDFVNGARQTPSLLPGNAFAGKNSLQVSAGSVRATGAGTGLMTSVAPTGTALTGSTIGMRVGITHRTVNP